MDGWISCCTGMPLQACESMQCRRSTCPEGQEMIKMADKRPYCVKCGNRMMVKRNDVSIPYGETGTQNGDLWECEICGTQIIDGFGEPCYRR